MVWLGDNTYLREADWNSRSGILHRYTHTRAYSGLQPLLASTHHYATWDDHDYGPDNSDRSYWAKGLTREAFELFWPNPSYGVPGVPGIATVFEWADTLFVLLDDRTHRSPNDRGTGERTMLGDAQVEWLIDTLVSSTATLKFVAVGGQFLNPYDGAETFAAFPQERERILRLLEAERIPGVFFLTGDRHRTELSKLERPGLYPLYDLTVSPLTAGVYRGEGELNSLRVEGTLLQDHNFASAARRGTSHRPRAYHHPRRPGWQRQVEPPDQGPRPVSRVARPRLIMSATRPRVPKPMWGFWSLALAVIVVVRYVLDVEVGIMNAITMGLLLVLVVPITFVWFVLFSGWPRQVRYGAAGISVLTLLGLASLFEFVGFRGDMMPIFTARSATRIDRIPELAAPGTTAIDVLTTTPYDFPGFLGANRDLRVDNVTLASDWETRPPELLWQQQIGAGWSGFAVVNGFAATLEERDGRELVTFYDARTGAQLWQRDIGGEYDNVLGGRGPRSTPTIDGGNVYVLGVSGNLVALEGGTGELIWEHDLLADYGVSAQEEMEAMTHGRAGSPLIVRDMLITAVGGSRARRAIPGSLW